MARQLADDPLVRQEVARLESGVRTIAANSARALAAVLRGEDPGGVASVNRLVKSEFEQHMHALALRAVGPYAALGSRAPDAVDKGRWTFGYLMSRATTIGAGTAEIQRNTIAESVLGLPSHRGEGTRAAAVTPGAPLAVPEEDERELREVLAQTLRAAVDVSALLDRKRAIDATEPAVWTALVDFGLPGLAVAESLGGGGARSRLLYAAIEEAAKALAPGAAGADGDRTRRGRAVWRKGFDRAHNGGHCGGFRRATARRRLGHQRPGTARVERDGARRRGADRRRRAQCRSADRVGARTGTKAWCWWPSMPPPTVSTSRPISRST